MIKFTITLVITLFGIAAIGQNQFIGLQGGLSLTNLNESSSYGLDFKRGIRTGLTYEYRINSTFQIGADLLYAQQGWNSDIQFTDQFGNLNGEKVTIQNKFNYISVPLKGGITIGNKISGYFNLGIVPSLIIKAESITPAYGNTDKTTAEFTSYVNKVDISGLSEVGVNYTIQESLKVFSILSFQHSINTFSNESYFPNFDLRHVGGTFSLGIKYALIKE